MTTPCEETPDEDGATHLLIRQVPPYAHHQLPLARTEFYSNAIPLILQVADNDQNQRGEVVKSDDSCTEVIDQTPKETANLDDFMDVITTYKCKFCPFNCAWKSGLMSHIRSTHLEVAEQMQQPQVPDHKEFLSTMETSTNVLPVQGTENSCTEVGDGCMTHEHQIFLCGQCSKGYGSLDLCKAHMVEDHQIRVESEESEAAQRSKKTKCKVQLPNEMSLTQEEDDEGNEEEVEEYKSLPNKRKTRPPKGLRDDYVLGRKKKVHREEDSTDRNFRCRECGCRFRLDKSLEYHMRCHSQGQAPFTCPECNENLDNWRLLSLHLWKVHKIDMDLHACNDCSYRTHSVFKLENHRRIHSDERSFVCATCGKGFKQVSQLRNHAVVHMDRKNMAEKRWYSEQECEICSRIFSDSKCLRKHLQAVHNKLKPFVCSFCGHTSARKAMLQLHMRQHTGEKPFECDRCEYRTGDHNSLRRHKMRHTGTKPYKCPHCPYACIQAISYKTHLKNKHPGMEGLFACSACSFRSVSRENYLNHLADHKRGAVATNAPSTVEAVVPGNVAAAQIIYRCLNALSRDAATTSSADGTRTFTIQIPAKQELQNAEQYYLAIEGPREEIEGAFEECKASEFTVAAGDELSAVQLIAADEDTALSLPLVITES